MLKTAEPRKGGVGVGGDNKAGRGESKLNRRRIDDDEVDGNKVDDGFDDEVGTRVQKLSKSKNLSKSKKTESGFLTSGARKAFTKLRQAFIKAPILYHFDSERYIRVETDASSYTIGGVFSQLTSDNLGQWHLIAFFLRKMIPAKTRYETHNYEFLAIVEAFMTWRHYLERFQHEVLVLTNHNNLRWFMKTKSLSSRQVQWAQELSRYHFQIDYRQGKANAAADALSWYPQQNAKKEETLCTDNVKILHRL